MSAPNPNPYLDPASKTKKPQFLHQMVHRQKMPEEQKKVLENKLFAAKPKRRAPTAQPPAAITAKSQVQRLRGGATPRVNIVTSNFIAQFDDRVNKPAAVEPEFEKPPMLYEGNFEEWSAAVDKMIAAHKAAGFRSFEDEEVVFARLVKPYICSEIFARIPIKATAKISDLANVLTKLLSKKFRLMDLPTELRARIFKAAVKSENSIVLFHRRDVATELREGVEYAKPPPVTTVSRQIRKESMHAYLEINNFSMNLKILPSPHLLGEEVYKWAKANKRWTPHLRELCVVVEASSGGVGYEALPGHDFIATFDPQEGFKTKSGAMPKPVNSQGFLDGAVSKTEDYRKTHGLQGEAVAMYFVDEKFWPELFESEMSDVGEMPIQGEEVEMSDI